MGKGIFRTGVFSIFLVMVLGAPSEAYDTLTKADIEQNILEGFAATAGFEIVAVDRVPRPSAGATLATPIYRDVVTYRLDPHPAAYKLKEEGLGHIKFVTLAWKEGREVSPFVFDFYLHAKSPMTSYNQKTEGGNQDKDTLAIRVAQLGIRKFLHQSIAPFSGHVHLTRLQAYFEEFSRKAKIIYRLPSSSLETILSSSALTIADRIMDIKITNNCREPGNYEVEVRDALGRYLMRANFSFPTKDYDTILTRFHGLGIRDQGTGFGVPNPVRSKEPFRYWDSFLPWKRMKSFPKVNINMLSLIRAAGGEQPPQSPLSGGTGEGIVKGDIEVVKGRVPFEDYQYNPEVMGKSGYHFPGPEPLSYIRVDATLPLPAGFQSPDKQASQPASYWRSNAHQGNVVPYHFQTFEDI